MKVWEQFNCYEVLGCDPACSPQEIKAAFRAASLRCHPDRGGSHDAQVRVNTAYDVLSDPVSRVSHDLHWRISRRARAGSSGRTGESGTRPASSGGAAKHPGIVVEPLGGLRSRVEQAVRSRRASIFAGLGDLAAREAERFRKEMRAHRQSLGWSFAVFVASGVAGVRFRILWLGTAIAGCAFIGHLSGPRLNGRSWSPFRVGRSWVEREAREWAEKKCRSDADAHQRYDAALAEMAELLLRESTFADTEAYVARRICAALFLLGYTPLQYLAHDRLLIFSDGSERTVVRFRHRSGAPTNVTYVERLVQAMRVAGTNRGYLFCSPGLSGNAARVAAENGITAYTLEQMHEWVHETLAADYDGPKGDILESVDLLNEFTRNLANALPASSAGRPHARRRRWGPWR